MGLFSKIFSRRNVPQWAGFFNSGQYGDFVRGVEADLNGRGLTFTINNGIVSVHADETKPEQMGLQNLGQLCNRSNAEEWPTLIHQHFDNLFSTHQKQAEFENDKANFETVRGLIKMRVFPEDLPPGVRENSIHRLLAPGLLGMLSYDFPTSIQSIPKEDAATWNLSHAELLELGLSNVLEQETVKLEVIDVPDGPRLQALVGDSFYTATHALRLDRHIAGSMEHGALVAMPHRHAVVFHPVHNSSAVAAIQSMLIMANGMYQEGPGSISPNLYWWRNGQFTILPSRIEKKKLHFEPPEEFIQVLNDVST